MKSRPPHDDAVIPADDHQTIVLDALKRAEGLFYIVNLSSCESALRVVKRFIEIDEWDSPEAVAERKFNEIAYALFDIGLRENKNSGHS